MYSNKKSFPKSVIRKRVANAVNTAISNYRIRKSKPSSARLYRMASSPNTIYRFRRVGVWTTGYNNYYGFTSQNGSTVYGNAIGISFPLDGPNITGSASSTTVALPSITDFSTLFDMYKVDCVHIKMFYTNNISNTSAAVGTFQNIALPVMQTCVDFDDAQPPSSGTELTQRPETRYLQLNSNGPIHFKIDKPKSMTTVLTGTGANSIAPHSQWLNMATTNVNTYGFKIYLEQFGSNVGSLQQGYFQFYFTYDIACKGVR